MQRWPDWDQSSSLPCISSSFLFNIGIVYHFDTVNHLDMVETGHMRTPSTCSRPPASLFPGWRKAGRGPGNEATHPLDLWTATQMSKIWCQITQTLPYTGLMRSVSYFMRSVINFVRPVSYSVKLVIKWLLDSHREVWQAEVQEQTFSLKVK